MATATAMEMVTAGSQIPDCEAPVDYVSCDGASDDPFKAIGLDCSDDPSETIPLDLE